METYEKKEKRQLSLRGCCKRPSCPALRSAVVYNFVLVERNLLLFVIPYIIIIYSLRKEVDIMNYISVKAASEKWGISERRIQKLCEENRIDGTEKFGRAWMIPKDAEKPIDGRMKTRNKQEENHGI